MTTLADIEARIASDLTRSDLTSQIANAVSDAIDFYQRGRFWFNVTRLQTFSTVAGQQAYGASDLSIIPNIIRVDALFILQSGTTTTYPLDRFEPADFEVIAITMGGGKPTAFTCVDQQILLWPVPNAVYTMRLHCHYKLPALVNPTDSNAWVTDAEELIRCHAKLLLYTDVLDDEEGMQRMQAKIPLLVDALKYETSARRSSGQIQGTEF
ncbi:MAG: hypothetical protein P4M07_28205 [Xanthobacteraceae bacterium]|nr:hypothetical protein [Xanthobacteraceae bacterium]